MASVRHRARIAALQALFELDATDHPIEQVVSRLVETEQLPSDGARFFERIVTEAWRNQAQIDQIIEEAAPNWPVNQMPGVDKAILRIALFEALLDDVERTPVKAVINEAVELAKHFGSDNSSRFVNGVLGTVVTRYLEHEDGTEEPG